MHFWPTFTPQTLKCSGSPERPALQTPALVPKSPHMHLTFASALQLAADPRGMSGEQTQEFLALLTGATLPVDEGAALLKAWAARGETSLELFSAVQFLQKHAMRVPVTTPCFDLCGTGGSGLSRYNISTTVAFILAAAGIPVAKHGNRGSSRPNGSFDLLDHLGIPFDFSPQESAQLQQETGLCFLFARTHHPEVGKVAPYRKAAGGRTIFNLAGPLSNPARIKHQLIGTIDEATARVVAQALSLLESEGALVVWGTPGLDEISITGKTGYLWVQANHIATGELVPSTKLDINYATLPAGDAPDNARTFFKLLSGSEKGPLLDMLVENAGAAIDLWNRRAPVLSGSGAKIARDLVRSGAALAKFEQHRDLAQQLANA